MKTRKKKPQFKCAIENCWNLVRVEGRFCVACQAWWYRIVLKDANDLAEYVRKVTRYSGRLGVLSPKKKVEGLRPEYKFDYSKSKKNPYIGV